MPSMRILVWLVRIAVFLVLLAFALNNQHDSSVHGLFGQEWRAPMVFIVLGAFALGCAFGVFAMVPSWWRHRRVARRHADRIDASTLAVQPMPPPDSTTMPPRDGL